MANKQPREEEEIRDSEARAKPTAEIDAIGMVPTYYIDAWWSTRWKGHIRLTFGETFAGKSYYRCAILLELSEAKALRDSLTDSIERMEKDEKAGE